MESVKNTEKNEGCLDIGSRCGRTTPNNVKLLEYSYFYPEKELFAENTEGIQSASLLYSQHIFQLKNSIVINSVIYL